MKDICVTSMKLSTFFSLKLQVNTFNPSMNECDVFCFIIGGNFNDDSDSLSDFRYLVFTCFTFTYIVHANINKYL